MLGNSASSWSIPGMFQEYSWNFPGTFLELSGNIPEPFQKRCRKPQETSQNRMPVQSWFTQKKNGLETTKTVPDPFNSISISRLSTISTCDSETKLTRSVLNSSAAILNFNYHHITTESIAKNSNYTHRLPLVYDNNNFIQRKPNSNNQPIVQVLINACQRFVGDGRCLLKTLKKQ